MPAESLEQVPAVELEGANRKLLQIAIRPGLNLTSCWPCARYVSTDRITQHFSLAPLSEKEVTAYLQHRLEAVATAAPICSTGQAVRIMTYASKGLTRRINILADKPDGSLPKDAQRHTPARSSGCGRCTLCSLPPVKRFGAPLLAGVGIACAVAFASAYSVGICCMPGTSHCQTSRLGHQASSGGSAPDSACGIRPASHRRSGNECVCTCSCANTRSARPPSIRRVLAAQRRHYRSIPQPHCAVAVVSLSCAIATRLRQRCAIAGSFSAACGNRSIHRNYCSTAPRWKDVLVTG